MVHVPGAAEAVGRSLLLGVVALASARLGLVQLALALVKERVTLIAFGVTQQHSPSNSVPNILRLKNILKFTLHQQGCINI